MIEIYKAETINKYKKELSNVKTGIFTSKIVDNDSYGNPLISNSLNIKFLEQWYDTANFLSKDHLKKYGNTFKNWCFYRTLKNKVLNEHIISPIPSSTTTSYSFANVWLHDQKCCILKIEIPLGSPIVFMDNHEDIPNDVKDYDFSSNQHEVTIPAGIIHIENTYILEENGVVVHECTFKTWSKEECLYYVHKHIKT